MITDKALAEAQAAAVAPLSLEGARVDTDAKPAKVVFSTRVPAEYSESIIAEAARCGQNPSQLIADLIAEALAARQGEADIAIPASDLRRLIATAQRRHAA